MAETIPAIGRAASEGGQERGRFIRAKRAAPTHQVRLVSREHLLTHLDRVLGTRLGVIVAPAGFGKTTILMQWHQFLSYIVLALASAGVDVGSLEAAAEQGMVGGALRPALSSRTPRPATRSIWSVWLWD